MIKNAGWRVTGEAFAVFVKLVDPQPFWLNREIGVEKIAGQRFGISGGFLRSVFRHDKRGAQIFGLRPETFGSVDAAVRLGDVVDETVKIRVGAEVERHLASLRPHQLEDYHRAFREAVALSMVLPPDVPLPSNLRRYEDPYNAARILETCEGAYTETEMTSVLFWAKLGTGDLAGAAEVLARFDANQGRPHADARALRIVLKAAETLRTEATAALAKGDAKAADALAVKFLTEHDLTYDVCRFRAHAYELIGHQETALQHYCKAARLNPLETDAYDRAKALAITLDMVGPKTDIYALGCMLFELITGSPPFSSKSEFEVMASHLNDTAPLHGERQAALKNSCPSTLAPRSATKRSPGLTRLES